MKKNMIAQIEQLMPQILADFKYLGENPELSSVEFATTAHIKKRLQALGIPCWRLPGLATGVIAEIQGKNPLSATLFLRADIDALPIDQSAFDLPLKSKHPGVAHCCGHHAHTCCVLYAGALLHKIRHEIEGTILCVFEPCEEVLNPITGAQAYMEAGLLNRPRIKGMLGLHCTPSYATGDIHLREGGFMASASEVIVRIKGKSGHVAQPHRTVNPVAAASEYIQLAQAIQTQHANPVVPTLIAFTKVHTLENAHANSNIVPSELELTGVFRTFDENWRRQMAELLVKLGETVAANHHAAIEVTIHHGIPPVVNDAVLTKWAKTQLEDLFGPQHIRQADLRLGGDTIGLYFQQIPGTYLRLGTGNAAKKTDFELHHPQFQVDEDALPIGILALAWLGYQRMVSGADGHPVS